MADNKPPLPDFADPPVIETVLGVEFAPLEGWKIPHFGLYWQVIRDEYPQFEIHPPLATAEEVRTPEDRIFQAVMVELLTHPPVRCWYLDAATTRLLQIQTNRFIHNWRKTGSDETYPRYERIRPLFEREWHRFVEFLAREKLGAPEPVRCEVTYVNHLVKGKEWEDVAHLDRVFPVWTGQRSGPSLQRPKAVAINVSYAMPEDRGQLGVQVQPTIRQRERKEILQLTLTAKGKPASPSLADVLAWFDLGRECVVRSFCDFTSPEMHKLWGRKE
jgi:uncharacterized protein (TIGR04255 family)